MKDKREESYTPRDLSRLRRELGEYLDSHNRFEWWEKDWELEDRGDLIALLELRRAMLQRDPEDGRLYLHLADAYILLGDFERALKVAARLHRAAPDDYEAQELIIELLAASGRDLFDFEWVQEPLLTFLDASLVERCRTFLLAERGACTTFELLTELFDQEHCLFDEDELAHYLARDDRFVVCHDMGGWLVVLRDAADGARRPAPCPDCGSS
jgi:tetratricopeptide (TPR) repeat protein